MWSVECKVHSVEGKGKTQDEECVKCRALWSVECGVWSAGCKVSSVECKVWSLECAVGTV